MALPPWLNISPMDYLRAVEAGTQAGLSIRQSNERAWESAQRMQMEQEAQQQHAQQLAVENMQNRLAQESLNQYRQKEAAIAAQRAHVADANEKAMQAFREAEVRETERRNLATEAETGRHNLATERPKPTKDEYRTAGGRLWKLDPDKGAIPLTPPVVTPETVTETSKVPAVEASPEVPASTGIPFLHWGAHPAIPGTNAAPEKLIRRTRKVLPSDQSTMDTDAESAPLDPSKRKANTKYKTPKGVFMWTGKGWNKPENSTGTIPMSPVASLPEPDEESDAE